MATVRRIENERNALLRWSANFKGNHRLKIPLQAHYPSFIRFLLCSLLALLLYWTSLTDNQEKQSRNCHISS